MDRIHFISKMINSVWGLDKIRGRTILASIIHPLLPHPKSERPEEDIFGDPLPCMKKLGDVAVIPITGVLSIDVPGWLKECGIRLTDVNDIEEEIRAAINDPNIKLPVFDMNSPGGLSIAGNRLFEIIEKANSIKRCCAYVGASRDAASAAYNAIAPCSVIASSPHADGVGCVGSYLAYLDDTDFWTQMGMKWEIFKSGEYKGIGESVPLTDAQRKFLQSEVDYYGDLIRANVKKYRPMIADEDLQGQWFPGRQAAQKNFVTTLADDLQSAITKFRQLTTFAA